MRILKAVPARERLAVGEGYTVTGLVVVDEIVVPLCPERYSDLFQLHAEAAGLPRIRLHDLRHSASSLLAANGLPIVTAAALLGHDPMVYAKTYAHHYAEDLRKASEVLSGLNSDTPWSPIGIICETAVKERAPAPVVGEAGWSICGGKVAPATGLEPVTVRLTVGCSAN